MEIIHPDVTKKIDQQLNTVLIALTIYHEGRGEPIEGQIAICNIINNRVHAGGRFGHTWKDIILRKKQFSCYDAEDKIPDCIVTDIPSYEQCYVIADAIFNDHFKDNTKGSNHYVSIKIPKPYWAEDKIPEVIIGNHAFYKL